jgi:hypothetical protein
MELKPLSPELDELRNVIIASNLASCYLVLETIGPGKKDTLRYEKFRTHWIETYKDIYDLVCKMKPRKPSR